MTATRLLSILLLLQTRGRVSAAELAREFEVSIRTIHRDIDQLCAAGIPVYADRGRGGGFRLLDGYHTRLTGLTNSEAQTIFLAGLPGPAAQLGLSDLLSASRLKLLAALPASARAHAERIASRFHLDTVAWFHNVGPLPSLQPVARAVWEERFLNLRYRRSGECKPRPRRLAPLGLVLKGGIWYVVAQNKDSIHTYRVSNIHDVELTDEVFERPEPFDLVGYWRTACRAYEAGIYREEAEVLLSPHGMRLLELFGPHVLSAAERTATKPDKYGWAHCRLPIESIEFGVRELMRLGEDVRVLGPRNLYEQWVRVLGNMNKVIGEARPSHSIIRK